MFRKTLPNKYVKGTLKAIGIFGLCLLVILVIAAAYVHFNKDEIIAGIEEKINNSISGNLTVKSTDVSILTTFPNVSVNLYEVSLTDSLYKKPLLHSAEIAIRINVFQLLSANPDVAKLVVKDAAVDLFKDSLGYSNSSALVKKDTAKAGKSSSSIVRKIEFRNVSVSISDAPLNKLYAFTFNNLEASINRRDSLLLIKMDEECMIKGLGFNLKKGSYLQNQLLVAKNWKLAFNTSLLEISFNKTDISINNQNYNIEGNFHLKDSAWFHIHVITNNVAFKAAAQILPENVQKKLGLIEIKNPLTRLEAEINGPLARGTDPHLVATWSATGTEVVTPVITFSNSSFSGSFNNHISDTLEEGDENTTVTINNLKADWGDIPLTSDSLVIHDLSNPGLKFSIASHCSFKQLDEQLALETIELKDGSAQLTLNYDGPLIPDPSLLSKLNANIKFENGTLEYIPRNISFINCNGSIDISENNVTADSLSCDVEKNHFEINIRGNDVQRLAQKDSGKTFISCNVFTPLLNLADFKSSLSSAKNIKKRSAAGKLAATALKIDDMLEKGDMLLDLKATKIVLDKFTANNMEAQFLFEQDDWQVQKAFLQHAGGSFTVSGKIHQVNASYHEAVAELNLRNVDIKRVFASFNNFGQDAITSANIEGKMNTTANLKLGLDNKGRIVENSIHGTVDFSVKNGALINYAPLQEIQKNFLKGRDFSYLTFAELKDRLTIDGYLININRIEIASSALTMYAEGVYSFREGTDISIQIPLSNLKDPNKDPGIKTEGVDARVGPSIYLRAKDGISGKVKIGVDLFRMLRKKKK